ncbi:hypothetical protein AB0L82_35945 [Nocardia sp. NPDC052001]|uniref:hypothetical protein n=1 Tax=Nocardia sp. NPDC052001 TaxID=3154853 RepID=UPI00341907CF
MAMVTFSTLSQQLATHMSAAHEDNQVFVLSRSNKPVAVLISHDLWKLGHGRASEPPRFQDMGTRLAQHQMKPIREKLAHGVHTVLTVDARPKAVVADYGWAREMLPELELPDPPRPPDCVLVVYRRALHLAELAAEFADSEDPDWEMDRRLTAGATRIPESRRDRLRAVVFVHEGAVARIRAIESGRRWEDLPGAFSLAPVSAPLSGPQIERMLPGLGMRIGDVPPARVGLSRQYLDL